MKSGICVLSNILKSEKKKTETADHLEVFNIFFNYSEEKAL